MNERFMEAVGRLLVPTMGTERVAPILYQLVQLVRPRHVLEIGMGYTTPFIALALQELRERSRAETADLAAKTRPYLVAGRPLDDEWLESAPALAAPAYYREPFEPVFVAVDDLRSAASSASRVRDVLVETGLDDLVTVIDGSLREARTKLPEGFAPIDLAWVDAWQGTYFFDHYWDLVNPAGGLMLVHYLLTYPEGAAVLEYIKATEQAAPGELEVVSLLEPHKLVQNSLTLVRRVHAYVDPEYAHDGTIDYDGVVRDDAAGALGWSGLRDGA
jgi:predicted O-methyltransferase YrrM